MEETLAPGSDVLVRGDRWILSTAVPYPAGHAVRLEGCGAANAGLARTLLTPFDRLRVIPVRPRPAVLPRRAWLRAVCRVAAASHPVGGLTTAAQSAIEILPYQLEPALAVARGATRLMIADAVGLGKTVQAGLILSELKGRASIEGAFRALIATPAGLREQWARELAAHFALSATVAGAAWLARMCRELPADVNPWVLPGTYVSSFDFLKRAEVLRPLEDIVWDLLVVDEAHNASLGTARRAALHAIALRSRRVVLLTATPHAGDPVQFDALCRLGEADRAVPLVIFRRSRQDAGAARARRTVLLPVRPSAAERRMHRLLDEYTARVCREARGRGDARARLAAIVLRKRALSSAASLARSAATRLRLLAGAVPARERQLLLPLVDDEELADAEPEAALAAPGLGDTGLERRLLGRIAEAAHQASGAESKGRALCRLLARVREPAIVFTEYRDTLARLQALLAAAGFQPLTLHGGQGPDERAGVEREMNARGALLLATDAAAEGLNLQSRCRLVIHYELPWSPARIEQRTGRVDRIGQHRTVHEVLLVAADTAERLVLAPLARRACRAREALPGSSSFLQALTESRVAAAVMEGAALSDSPALPPPDPDDSARTIATGIAEAERLRVARAWMQGPPASDSSRPLRGVLLSMSRQRPRTPGAIVIIRIALAGRGRRVEHAQLVAVRDSHALPPEASDAAALRRALDTWKVTRESAVLRVIASHTAESMAASRRQYADVIAQLECREAAIADRRPCMALALVQAGLFDRRSVRASEARQRSAAALLGQHAARLASLDAAADLGTTLELVAVFWDGRG